VTFRSRVVREYRDFLGIDDRLGQAHWLVQHNGGVFLPPWGKVEQWLLSVQHDENDVDRFTRNFGKLAAAVG
jgi:glutamate-1-semialdehyde 2,1-aminomutase